MLKPEAARGDEFRRFESEARMIAGFDHPNLVTVFDIGRDEKLGCYYYTMNYVAGPTLSAMGRLSIEDAAPIVSAVLAGLTQLHNAHIVHRDIKPANILITTDGRAMLADLGIARDQLSDQRFTRRGSTIGTVRYMAPEQARGEGVVPASDVFSMGLMLYEVLTGNSVYDKAANDVEILFYIGARFHAKAELEFAFPREVPRSIQDVIRKACRMARDERYATALEMREALQRALGELRPRTRVRPWQIAAGVAVVAVIGAGSWAGSSLWTRREARLLDGQVLAAADLAKQVLESVSATQPPPDYAMIAGSQQQFDTAEVTRQNGRRELDAGHYDDAAIYLRLALQGFETTCERLAREHLEPQLVAIREDLDARGKELEALGAESLTPVRWSEFQAKRGALVTAIESASACERGDRIRLRTADAGAVLAVAARVFTELGALLPDLARVARQEAETARGEAIRNESESELYRAVFERGERAFAEGLTAADSGRHVEARDTLRASAADFDEAAKLGDAIAQRKRVGEAEDRAVARRVRDFGVASLVLSRGEERFAARDWTAAGASYERAVGEIDALVAPPEPVAVAPRTPAASSAAREPATRGFDRRRIFGPAARGPDPEVRRLADGSGRRRGRRRVLGRCESGNRRTRVLLRARETGPVSDRRARDRRPGRHRERCDRGGGGRESRAESRSGDRARKGLDPGQRSHGRGPRPGSRGRSRRRLVFARRPRSGSRRHVPLRTRARRELSRDRRGDRLARRADLGGADAHRARAGSRAQSCAASRTSCTSRTGCEDRGAGEPAARSRVDVG